MVVKRNGFSEAVDPLTKIWDRSVGRVSVPRFGGWYGIVEASHEIVHVAGAEQGSAVAQES